MNDIKGKIFSRAAELAGVKVTNRAVEVSFSSEYPAQRHNFKEVLLHGPENVDLTRLREVGAALLSHDPRSIVGSLASVRIENRRGKATVVFDDDELGNLAMRKVESGSLKGVSCRYIINAFEEIRAGQAKHGVDGPAIFVTKWTPFELSLTPIPVDPGVGVARDLLTGLGTPGYPMGIEAAAYRGLLQQARIIGGDAVERFAEMVAAGRSEFEIGAVLLERATAGRSGTPTRYRSLADVPDDVFLRSLTDGAAPLEDQTSQARGTSGGGIAALDDDTFIRALTGLSADPIR